MKTTLFAFAILSLSVAAGCGSSNNNSPTDGPVLYTLTVQNYLDWCDVTENGTVYPASAPPVMSFAPGTVVDLNAVAATGFVWGSGQAPTATRPLPTTRA